MQFYACNDRTVLIYEIQIWTYRKSYRWCRWLQVYTHGIPSTWRAVVTLCNSFKSPLTWNNFFPKWSYFGKKLFGGCSYLWEIFFRLSQKLENICPATFNYYTAKHSSDQNSPAGDRIDHSTGICRISTEKQIFKKIYLYSRVPRKKYRWFAERREAKW